MLAGRRWGLVQVAANCLLRLPLPLVDNPTQLLQQHRLVHHDLLKVLPADLQRGHLFQRYRTGGVGLPSQRSQAQKRALFEGGNRNHGSVIGRNRQPHAAGDHEGDTHGNHTRVLHDLISAVAHQPRVPSQRLLIARAQSQLGPHHRAQGGLHTFGRRELVVGLVEV
ncbi:Uncharacterised protein [Mycobacterium tuberculosis]|nr:Uncharacterised protein [Mycobacterium tuberculosis]